MIFGRAGIIKIIEYISLRQKSDAVFLEQAIVFLKQYIFTTFNVSYLNEKTTVNNIIYC